MNELTIHMYTMNIFKEINLYTYVHHIRWETSTTRRRRDKTKPQLSLERFAAGALLVSSPGVARFTEVISVEAEAEAAAADTCEVLEVSELGGRPAPSPLSPEQEKVQQCKTKCKIERNLVKQFTRPSTAWPLLIQHPSASRSKGGCSVVLYRTLLNILPVFRIAGDSRG